MQMPEGLPECLNDTENGFELLKQLVGLRTTVKINQFLNDQFVKSKLKTISGVGRSNKRGAQKRHQLISAFFNHPDWRRDIWQAHFDHDPTFGEDPNEIPTHSLERTALLNYNKEFYEPKVDVAEPESFVFLDDAIDSRKDWQRPVVKCIWQIQRDFSHWESQNDESRQRIALALFSIATILDDARVLQWGIKQVPNLAREYKFAAELFEETGPATEDALSKFDEVSSAQLRDSLEETCQKLIDAATQLIGVNPNPGLLDELSQLANKLQGFRPYLMRDRFQSQIHSRVRDLCEYLEDHASEASWIKTEIHNVRDRWESVASADAPEDIDRISTDIQRAHLESERCIGSISELNSRASEIDAEIHRIDQELQSSVDAQIRIELRNKQNELDQEQINVDERINDLKRDLQTAIFPRVTLSESLRNNDAEVGTISEADDESETHEDSQHPEQNEERLDSAAKEERETDQNIELQDRKVDLPSNEPEKAKCNRQCQTRFYRSGRGDGD